MQEFKVRVAPSIGELERTFEEAWDLETYNPETDQNEPTVFVGLYGLPDFFALWRHKGEKYIFWCGSDIRHFKKGYWLDDNEWGARLDYKPLANWINKHCKSWVENELEMQVLAWLGIKANICPSFLGDISKYDISYKWSNKPKVYTSVSGDDFELYGWDKIPKLAKENPDMEFHCYGTSSYIPLMEFQNVFIHGRVPKEKMNEEIKNMQGALRLVEFEGFSEIVAKSILWGQWPISLIEYPFMLSIDGNGLELLKNKKEPNVEGREYYFKILNQFPWKNTKSPF